MKLIKFSRPTKLDAAPHYTLWVAQVDEDGIELYIQTGNEEKPEWKRVGDFIEKAILDEKLPMPSIETHHDH